MDGMKEGWVDERKMKEEWMEKGMNEWKEGRKKGWME